VKARRLAAGAALLLPAALLLALHLRTLGYELVWMDEAEIGEREAMLRPGDAWTAAFQRPLHMRSGDALAKQANPYYRPLQVLLVTAIDAVAGPDPRAFRAVSLVTGCAAVTAFALLAFLLFERAWPAALAASLVAVHPAGLEAFVWISGISEGLSDLFVVVGLTTGLLCIGPRPAWSRAARVAAGALSLAALAIALFSKEKGIVLPPLLLAAVASRSLAAGSAVARLAREPERSALHRGMILLALQAAVIVSYLVLRWLLLGHGLVSPGLVGGSRMRHLLSALGSWPASLAWIFFPASSSTSDVVQIVTSPVALLPWLGIGLALGSAVAWVALVRAGRPVAALGLAWIWIAFLPTSNLLPQIHARAERYVFLSVFGAALLVVDGLRLATSRLNPALGRTAFAGVGLALVAALAQRTGVRTPAWRSTQTLFEADVAAEPRFREGRQHLALALFRAGRYAEADVQLEALVGEPSRFEGSSSYVNPVGVQELRCQNQLALGRAGEVVRHLERLGASEPQLSALPAMRACLAQAQAALGRPEQALDTYLAIVRELPEEPPAALSLLIARTHADLHQVPEALGWLERARRTGPREPAFHRQLDQVERQLRASGER
jgi:tetratricopeptide (TPR) repeat protein